MTDCALICLPSVIIAGLIFYALVNLYKWIFLQISYKAWNQTPKDVVVIHGFVKSKISPTLSPFVLKLLTFVRMSGIPHQIEWSPLYVFGPKGKTPWISLNGQHIGDTELIIDFLKKKFNKQSFGSYTQEQIAVGTSVRVMLEEHAFWGSFLERFGNGKKAFANLLNFGKVGGAVLALWAGGALRKAAYHQGLGRHKETELYELVVKDLRATSVILGNKPFILGDEPSQDDCGIFGIIFNFTDGLPDSVYSKLFNDELLNLKQYCTRMKNKYFEDWDELCDKN